MCHPAHLSSAAAGLCAGKQPTLDTLVHKTPPGRCTIPSPQSLIHHHRSPADRTPLWYRSTPCVPIEVFVLYNRTGLENVMNTAQTVLTFACTCTLLRRLALQKPLARYRASSAHVRCGASSLDQSAQAVTHIFNGYEGLRCCPDCAQQNDVSSNLSSAALLMQQIAAARHSHNWEEGEEGWGVCRGGGGFYSAAQWHL